MTLALGAPRLELRIGKPDNRDPKGLISLPYDVLEAHMHVLGQTRSGKSRFLADMVRQLISANRGVCVLDPHGELHDITINWLAQNPFVQGYRKNIHAVDLADPNTMFRYNPLHIEQPADAYAAAGNVVNAITRIFGGNNATETPLTGFVLDVICVTLALQGKPLAAAQEFVTYGSPKQRDIRQQIIAGNPDPYYQQLGEELMRKSPREFTEEVGSAGRRLHQFLGNPYVRRMFSTTEKTANFRQLMDERQVLLLNATPVGPLGSAHMRAVGMLITNNLLAVARQRKPQNRPPAFHFIVDEVQNYISDDIGEILAEAGKRSFYLTLAHQDLGQLIRAGEHIYAGVMTNALIKTVFQIPMADGLIFADEMFANQVDFQRVKKKLATHHIVGHQRVMMRGGSVATGIVDMKVATRSIGQSDTDAEARSSTTSSSRADIDGTVLGSGDSTYIPDEGDSDGHTESQNESRVSTTVSTSSTANTYSSTHSTTRSKNQTDGTTRGISTTQTNSWSEGLVPILRKYSTVTYSLEEQRYEFARQLSYQAPRHAFMTVRRTGNAMGFTTREIKDPLHIPVAENKLREHLTKQSPWIAVGAEAKNCFSSVNSIPEPEKDADPDSYFEKDA